MHNNILSAFSAIEIMVGTIISVLSILKMTLKDVMSSCTWGGIRDAWIVALTQRHYARCGIITIIVGTVVQIISIFVTIKLAALLIIVIIGIIIPVTASVILTVFFKKTKKEGHKVP